ncbi:hypothetical protein [Streptomyces sp. NPDC047070]|uniref:hypothetical protein n=1 Tax=Streptomyces sp. NPDC047070 TaxID=3154923 RepID=UPI0034560C8F
MHDTQFDDGFRQYVAVGGNCNRRPLHWVIAAVTILSALTTAAIAYLHRTELRTHSQHTESAH